MEGFLSDQPTKYGELILLGYNGNPESSRSNGKKHHSKMVFKMRETGNGIKKGSITELAAPPKQSKIYRDNTKHTVSFSYNKHRTVLVEYTPDHLKDMFQIGRSSEEHIDFTIVDTWLAAGPNTFQPSGKHGFNADDLTQKPISSTISRYACRFLFSRNKPEVAHIYAAGFDSSKNIFLGEKATKWTKHDGELDGLTTNGVLILHPNTLHEGNDSTDTDMYIWREVSVDGEIYSLRETRSATKRGELISGETNQLQDGTLIDLCGATLLWRSAKGLQQSPSTEDLDRQLDELNAGKPQCPVNLNTLVIPKRRKENSSRQPYVYLACGHVQGKHSWGVIHPSGFGSATVFRCPICMTESEKVVKLAMGMEAAFHLDSDRLNYAFNPCGHVASFTTVRYWSRIPLPHGTNSFFPVCPFCTILLNAKKPYVRLIFQDHLHDNCMSPI